MEIWQALVLGFIEGLTEFIPVSSTGHLIIANSLLGLSGETAASFDVCIQGGAILAVLLLFKERFSSLFTFRITKEHFSYGVAIIPFLIAGALFGGVVKRHLFGPQPVAYALIVGGTALIFAARYFRAAQRPQSSTSDRSSSLGFPTVQQALVIGLFQLGALWPGMSRSACTIVGGLVAGLPLVIAAEFSFLIAVPILLAASANDAMHAATTFSTNDLFSLAIGFIASFVFAVLSLRIFMSLLAKVGLAPFGWYRIGLGVIVLVFVQ